MRRGPEGTPPYSTLEPAGERIADPARMLTEHVALVRQRGDAIDNANPIRHGSAIKSAALSGGVLGTALAESSINLGQTYNPAVYGTVLALSGVFLAGKLRHRSALKRGTELLGEEAQNAIGQHYELYATGKGQRREVTMRWYGPNHDTPASHGLRELAYITALAKTSGVGKIIIGERLTRQFMAEIPVSKYTMAGFLSKKKKLLVGGQAEKDLIHIKTPDEWSDAARSEQIEGGYSLNRLLDSLAEYRYDHPLLKKARAFSKADSAKLINKLKPVARTSVERQLSDVRSSRLATGVRIKQGVYSSISADGSSVHRYADGRYDSSLPLRRAIGMSDDQLLQAAGLLKPPQDQEGQQDKNNKQAAINPNTAIRALEVLIFKKLYERPKEQSEGTEPSDHSEDNLAPDYYPYQRDIINFPKRSNPEAPKGLTMGYRRVWRGISFAAAGFVIWRRKDLENARRAMLAKLASNDLRHLQKAPVDHLRLAAALLGQAGFGPDMDLRKAHKHAKGMQGTRQTLVHQLTKANSSLHSQRAHQALKEAARQTPRSQKQQLKPGLRMARKARRVIKHGR